MGLDQRVGAHDHPVARRSQLRKLHRLVLASRPFATNGYGQRRGKKTLRLSEQSKQIEGEPETVKQPLMLRAVTTERKEARMKPRHSFELPLDPDIIARYLAGEDLATEPPEPQPTPPRPTLALIAACVALGIFLVSIWIARR